MSIRKDIDKEFEFPEPIPLTKRLKDVLDEGVEEKYYLTDEQTERLRATRFQSEREEYRVQDGNECRTLLARDYKDPKCVRVGGLYDKPGNKHQAGSVYDPNGISATLSTMQGGNQEPIIVASRGRGENNEQTLEARKDGLTNTITSVQKDNYVAEPSIEVIGNYSPSGHEASRVINSDGIAPTVKENHGTITAVIAPIKGKSVNIKGCGNATDSQ